MLNLNITIETIHMTSYHKNIMTFENIVRIDPAPPEGFHKIASSLSMFYPPECGDKMYYFCADNRDEMVQWFNRIGINARTLFGQSFFVILEPETYSLFTKLRKECSSYAVDDNREIIHKIS